MSFAFKKLIDSVFKIKSEAEQTQRFDECVQSPPLPKPELLPPPPPPHPSPPRKPVDLPVVDCCGIFGYLIPWAEWKCEVLDPRTGLVVTPAIVPTRDFSRQHVFLYSITGQLGDSEDIENIRRGFRQHTERTQAAATLKKHGVDVDLSDFTSTNCIGVLCLDNYYDNGTVHWSQVRHDILNVAGY